MLSRALTGTIHIKGKYMEQQPAFKIKCTFEWLKLLKPDDMSDKYQVVCSNLSDEDVAKINAIQKDTVPTPNGKVQLKVKTQVQNPPRVKDEEGNLLVVYPRDEDGRVIEGARPKYDFIIGNGSEGYCTVYPHYSEKWRKVTFLLNEIVITKLVKFVPETQGPSNEAL